jgi:hypothetical protein
VSIPLDFLRSVATAFRPDTCTIQRATDTSSGDGTSQAWATLASGVTCRVSRAGQGNEQPGATGGIVAVGQRRIKLPAGQDVTTRDRIVTGGVTYEVVDVPRISNEVERMAICREVQ